ncbi:hypothetical protein ACQKGO_09485 [Corallococcus interemptor]|uniref:hypothetical protein n=1 Tax=Corallococcus interemptor TaxID=2316720 RepID=UPI003D08A951
MSRDVIVDFNVLPHSTRERLIASTRPHSADAPLFSDEDRTTQRGLARWIVAGLLGLGHFCFIALTAFGTPGARGVQDVDSIIAYALTISLMVAAVLGIAYHRKRGAGLPFVPGRYLFPLEFVDLREPRMRIRSLNGLIEFKGVHQHVNGTYSHTSFFFTFQGGVVEEFQVRDKHDAERRLQVFQRVRKGLAGAMERQDANALQQLDAFFDVRMKGGFQAFQGKSQDALDTGPRASGVPSRLGRRWLTSLTAGVVLGITALLLRNLASDYTAFEAARKDGSGAAFHRYMLTGWRYVDEARRLGAEAEFTGCEEEGAEACWLTYLERWDGSPRSKEVREERLPRAALAEADDTVSALRRFRTRYPASVVDGEAKARIHELFVKSLAEFKDQASTTHAGIVPFVGGLMAHLEATDNPRVLLRFRQQSSPTLAKADKLLGKAMRRQGREMAMVSRHFEPQYTQPLEQAITEALSSAFMEIFPTDLLTLQAAPAGQPVADTAVPVLEIVYTIDWSGNTYSSVETRRVFVGIQFEFSGDMRVPDQKPLRFGLRVNPPDFFTVQFTPRQLELVGLNGRGPSDDDVYRVMALRAFDQLSDKLRQVFFRPTSKAFQASTLGGSEEAPEGLREALSQPSPP